MPNVHSLNINHFEVWPSNITLKRPVFQILTQIHGYCGSLASLDIIFYVAFIIQIWLGLFTQGLIFVSFVLAVR